MNAILKAFTAISALLALPAEASANMNSISLSLPRPSFVNPGLVRPIVRLRTMRPAIAPRQDTEKSSREDKAGNRRKAKQNAPEDSARSAGRKSNPGDIAPARKIVPSGKRRIVRSAGPNSVQLPDNPPLPMSKPRRGLDGMRDTIATLQLFEEIAKQHNLKQTLEGNVAIDQAALGEGADSGRGPSSGFDWKNAVPDGNTREQGPQNDQIWKVGLPETSAYDRGAGQAGGFTPPWQRGQSSDRDLPGFGRTPGSAGGGLKGQRGWTSQDGQTRHGTVIYDARRGDKPFQYPSVDGEDHGAVVRTTDRVLDDGDLWVTTRRYEDGTLEVQQTVSRRGDVKNTWITTYTDGSQRIETMTSSDPEGTVRYRWPEDGPDTQPAPDQPLHAGPMPCPTTSSGCGPDDEPMSNSASRWEKVTQPGKGDRQGDGIGFRASVAERKNVVTNPVDPANHQPRGGGTGPRPIEHVTQPGGAGPGDPRG